jgi:hypothetical protein
VINTTRFFNIDLSFFTTRRVSSVRFLFNRQEQFPGAYKAVLIYQISLKLSRRLLIKADIKCARTVPLLNDSRYEIEYPREAKCGSAGISMIGSAGFGLNFHIGRRLAVQLDDFRDPLSSI